MRCKRVLTVLGTRPEAIKLAPVIQGLAADGRFESIVAATAQHRSMLDQVLQLFDIHPDFDLDLMREDQPLPQLTAAILSGLDPILETVQPDWLLVQGDTTTVMAAALAAFYRSIRIGHVEAGLRTGSKSQPFPEEINRRIASVLADLHFAPTEWAKGNLLREGIPESTIRVTGNTIMDALAQVSALPMPADMASLLEAQGVLSGNRQLIVVTAHRRESFGQPIREICAALKEIAQRYSRSACLVYPVHLNPNIQEPVHELLGSLPNVILLPPLEYLPLVHLLKHARLILTDSGGIQEEATGLGIPCLVLREVTERPEGVEAGVLKLVGTERGRIVEETSRLLEDEGAYTAMAHAANPYGDGKTAGRIIQALAEVP
jgi:UDP-N-acetylglucosamine 2-epimerase (non-hydrolysing)